MIDDVSMPEFRALCLMNVPLLSFPTRPAIDTGIPNRAKPTATFSASPPVEMIGGSIRQLSCWNIRGETGYREISQTIIPTHRTRKATSQCTYVRTNNLSIVVNTLSYLLSTENVFVRFAISINEIGITLLFFFKLRYRIHLLLVRTNNKRKYGEVQRVCR